MSITQAELARTISVSSMRMSHVVKDTRPVTAVMALLSARNFDQSPQYWLNLQAAYDLKVALAAIGERLADEHSFTHF